MDSNGSLELHAVGDVELWVAEGANSSWMLPLIVEWKENPSTKARYGLVLTPLCFYETQLVALRALLNEHAQHVQFDQVNGWLLREAQVIALLKKAPGIHPEFYYRWADTAPPMPSPYRSYRLDEPARPEPRRLREYRDFAHYLQEERHVPEDVAIMVLTAIGQVGARWMLEHRKTLDFGFVKLVALPFRVNWKEVILWKCKPWKIIEVLRRPRKPDREAELDARSFQATCCSSHNIGLRWRDHPDFGRYHRLDYTIEAVTTAAFDNVADGIERNRMRSGQTSYVTHYEQAVEHFYDRIVEVLTHYARKVYAPWATVRPGRDGGILRFLPVGRLRAKVRGVSLADLPTYIVPPDSSFSVFAESQRDSDPHLVRAQALEMQKMPDVSPPPDDVRECEEQGDVDEPRQD